MTDRPTLLPPSPTTRLVAMLLPDRTAALWAAAHLDAARGGDGSRALLRAVVRWCRCGELPADAPTRELLDRLLGAAAPQRGTGATP